MGIRSQKNITLNGWVARTRSKNGILSRPNENPIPYEKSNTIRALWEDKKRDEQSTGELQTPKGMPCLMQQEKSLLVTSFVFFNKQPTLYKVYLPFLSPI